MATRIMLRQIEICPVASDASEEAVEANSVVIPHTDKGRCEIVGSEFAGGGTGNWILDVIILVPVEEKKPAATKKSAGKAKGS